MPINLKHLLSEDPRPGEILRAFASQLSYLLPPQVFALIGVKQSKEWHPEGDAFRHTTFVMDEMARICIERGITGRQRLMLAVAALCHDLGKATATKWHEQKGKWVSYGHDEEGVPIAEAFMVEHLAGLLEPDDMAKILKLVRWHMVRTMQESEHTRRSARKLLKNLKPATFDDLLLLMEADCGGRPPLPGGLPPSVHKLTELVREIEAKAPCGV